MLTLSPELRARLRGLRIAPRRARARGGIGQHRGRERGSGMEFAQYRAYEPGDELKAIDWKLYARSDRLFVREAERESPLTVWLLGDLFDPASVDLATRLAAARREVLAIQLLTVGERDFNYRGGRRFEDPETGEVLPGDGAALRTGFFERFGVAQAALAARLDAAGIRHVRHVLDEPLDAPLRALFAPQGRA